MSLLRIEGLSVAYAGQAVVRDLSLNVAPGEIVALVGESGSGKSSVALAALGLLPDSAATSGSIAVAGQELASLAPRDLDRLRGATVSMIFQEPLTALNPAMRIGAQVAEAIRLHDRFSRREAHARAIEVLARVGLPAEVGPPDRYPHELSGGQRQRVGIAIAIAARPKLLIADEPTTALDVTTQAHVLAMLRRLVAEDGMGLLLVSHDLAVVADIADRILVMKNGGLVEQGKPRDLLLRPQAAYTQTLVDAVRRAPARAVLPEGPPLLEVQGVTRRHGRLLAVDGASFVVGRGETVGLVGESGSGKTTLLRTILALDPPQAGDVLLGGESIVKARGRTLRRLRRDIQAVFQDPGGSLDPRHRVERIVAEPLHLLDERIDRTERRRRVEKVLGQVGLSAADADRFPHQFSGGQRQRIAIARALIVEPALVVLDEAVSALDVSVRAGILDLLADLSVRLGLSYLFVSHDLAMMRNVADRLVVLRHGRIVEQGRTATILARPAHAYTAELLAATPDIDAALDRRAAQA
jgi:peptide/nickel transport system ATP-binding protein